MNFNKYVNKNEIFLAGWIGIQYEGDATQAFGNAVCQKYSSFL